MIQFLNSEIETTTTNREAQEPSVELQHLQALKDTVHEEQELTNELYEESGASKHSIFNCETLLRGFNSRPTTVAKRI